MAAARKKLKLDRPFEMRRGGTLSHVQVAYETWGDLAFCHDNAVLIFTGLSPSAHAASSTEDPAPGWWEDMIGPGRPIDTRRSFVICVTPSAVRSARPRLHRSTLRPASRIA